MKLEQIQIHAALLINRRLQIIESQRANKRLFFGLDLENDSIQAITRLADGTDDRNLPQLSILIEAILRAMDEKRNVFLKYTSHLYGGKHAHVTAHVIYLDEETVCLQATEVNEDDVSRIHEKERKPHEDWTSHSIQETIYENLPLGVEMYDRDGRLIEINPAEMRVMGIKDKSDVLGIDLFKNPNLPDLFKKLLREGKNVHFTQEYDFDQAAKEYYDTTVSGNHHFDVNISVVRDADGAIDKYLIISQNITEQVLLQKKYETLYNQTMTILDSLPVGVELYDPQGNLLFLNNTDCRIFGVERDSFMQNPINIHQNPNLPEAVKKAARDRENVYTHFPYSFNTVAQDNYFTTNQTNTIYIRCNGTPIINPDGKEGNYVFIVENVTDIVHHEEEQRQNRRKTELSMKAANMMLWEFDNRTQQFFSDNDPLNGYNPTKPLTIDDYNNTIHPDDRVLSTYYIQKMINGEENLFDFELRFKFPGNPNWQYCTLSGIPYEEDASGRIIRYVGFRKNNTELQNKKVLQDNILNNIPLPIHIKDIEDNFRYVFCNKESQRMFGSKEGQTIYDVWDESLVYAFRNSDLEAFHSGKPYFGEARILLKDGREYETIVRKCIIEDGDKRLLLSIYWDQSVQNELDRRSKVLSLSMNALNAYTWEYDVKKDRFRYGEGFESICPNSADLDTHSKFAEYVHPDDRQIYLDSLENIKNKDQGDFTLEYRVDLTGKGMYEWWECRGTLETRLLNNVPYKYVFGMDVNINAHKKTEFALLKNKEELSKFIRQNELVLNNANSGLAYISPDYIVQWENVSLGTTDFEYEAYKKGEPCYKSAHNRTKPCEDCVLQKVMQTKKTERKKFKLDSGQTIEVYSTPVFDENDTIDGIVIRIDNITEREQIDGLRQAKIVAEQSDKLKSAFLANMSHEIRTPLNAIIGFSNLLMATTDPDEQEEFIRIIENSNELLLKLINDILDLSKIEAGTVELKFEDFNLSEYFNSMAISMRQRKTNPDVELIAQNPYSNCTIYLDKTRVAQIMTNYVTNAIKYTPKGTIEMGYTLIEKGVRLYVRDTGIGIQESKQDKVFLRFEKLDEFAQGTGLGLSICKAIAESMGGTVGFKSEHGQGSLFWADLPCLISVMVE